MNIREKILIVEDEARISRFISTILNSNGYEAIQAQTGQASAEAPRSSLTTSTLEIPSGTVTAATAQLPLMGRPPLLLV